MNFREKFIDDDLAYCVEFYAFLNSYEKEFIDSISLLRKWGGKLSERQIKYLNSVTHNLKKGKNNDYRKIY